ncbi:hypothetical protein T10_5131 [Trichinella papuae]|uniref:Uncharacterized protein n=1 Tax=Trichinella papuae TaxID=268474 RepID=A0A0V1MNN1_9BILA|nr:hypothetical protein T10_5131 [Trichinella papuae]
MSTQIMLNTVREQLEFLLTNSLWDHFLEVLKSPYQPAVEYEQADVSTANNNKIFLIFIIKIFIPQRIESASALATYIVRQQQLKLKPRKQTHNSSKQSVSIVSSSKDDRNFVTKSPAALKLRSAQYDVGGTVIMSLDVAQQLRRQPFRP